MAFSGDCDVIRGNGLFVRLFITQVIRRLADEMKFKDGVQLKNYTHRLLLMLDEFPSLGNIAGYGLKAYLIAQDISQLHKIYGRDDVICSNCHVQVSVSLQEISRPLLTVDECMRLKGAEKDAEGRILVPGDMLIFIAGHPAVYGKQMLFFLDGELSKRSQFPTPERSDRTVEKRDSLTGGEDRAPILGESGEHYEPCLPA